MLRRTLLLFLAILSPLAACGDDPATGPDAAADTDAAAPDATAPDADTSCADAAQVIFLNRAGGTYQPGAADDPTTNTSAMLAAEATVSAFPHDDAAWAETVACVEALFAPFNVRITDVDPGAVPHVEVVVTGTDPTEIGMPANYMSVSPSVTCNGEVEPAIAYMFAGVSGPSTRDMCWQIGFAGGITMELDFVLSCEDVMIPRLCSAEGPRFLDSALTCGAYEASDCRCGGTTQNSYQKLLDIVGPACE